MTSNLISLKEAESFLGHKAPLVYFDRVLSFVCRVLDYLHFQFLQNRLMKLGIDKYSRSLASVVVFRLETKVSPEGKVNNNKPKHALLLSRSMSEEVLFLFHSLVKFLTRFDVFSDLVILAYFNANSLVLTLHLFCVVTIFISERLLM